MVMQCQQIPLQEKPIFDLKFMYIKSSLEKVYDNIF